MARPLIALATLLASTHIAAAEPKRGPVRVTVELSARVKPTERKAATAAPAAMTADAMMAIQVLTSPIHAEQEQILVTLIERTPDSEVDEKAELYFRLGELYAKQHRLYRLKSVEAEIKKNKAAATTAAETAHRYLAKAAGTYKALTENTAFVSFAKMDLALFVYAYTLQSGNFLPQARAVWDKLLKNYPSSKYVAEAHLAFAEYYWEAGQLADAEDRYKRVLKSPQSNAYWYAMYKLGWIQLNRSKFSEALETFYQVAHGVAKDPTREVLYRNAKKDFVRAYSEVGKVDKALVAFKRVAPRGAFEMLETLAGFYMEQGNSAKAIFAYRELMKLAPKHSNVCQWQYEITHATLSLPGATNADKVREIADLNRLYGALASSKILPGVQATECRDNAAAMSGELARAYHAEYAKTFSADSFAAASKLYATYLATFPTAADAPKTQYLHADLLWNRSDRERDARLKTELWEQTASAFTEVVKTGTLAPTELNDAAYAMILAYLYAHDSDPRKVAAPPVDAAVAKNAPVPTPRPLPAREQKMLAAFDLYLAKTKSPPVDDLVQMKFLKGNVLRRFDHLAAAAPLFEDIITRHPTHATAEVAARLLVDIRILTKDKTALLALTNALLANTAFLTGKDDLKAQLKHIQVIALREAVEGIEARARKTKDLALFVQCGEAYLEIYNADPEDEQNDEILYNAGVCFEEGRSLETSIRMFELLERFYPKSRLAARGIARVGNIYSDMALYGLAATKLEQYAKKYAGEADAFDAMSDAVFYYKGIGNDAKAIEDTRYFIKTFGAKKPGEAANAAFALTAIYEKQADKAPLIKHLREYIRVHGAKGGPARLAIAQAKLGQLLFTASCGVKGVDGACIKVTRERAVSSRAAQRVATAQRTQCGPDSKIKLTVTPRDASNVRDARAAFAAAIRDFAKVPATSPEYGLARHHVAQAKLAESTLELESYFALAFPTSLDFDPRRPDLAKKSMKRFETWLVDKEAHGVRAAQKLAGVLQLQDSASSIAAAARLGQISQHFADALFTAEIPRDVRTGPFAEDKIDAYCDVLTTKAEPLAARALDAFSDCLDKSTQLGWFSEWSQLCERELGQIQPDTFPTASERRSAPDRIATFVLLEAAPKLD